MATAINPVIHVQIKNVFGNETIYPACRQAEIFADIAGTKTLTRDTLQHIQSLGFGVRVATPTLPR